MSDTPKKSINRTEELDNPCPALRIVTSDWITFVRSDQNTHLENKNPHLYFFNPPETSDTPTICVASATNPSDNPYQIHAPNTLFVRVELTERDLTQAEDNWCENTMMHGGSNKPDTIYEFTIPDPDALETAALNNDIGAFSELTVDGDGLTSPIPDTDTREHISQTLQMDYEKDHFIEQQLSVRNDIYDVPPEWDPEREENGNRAKVEDDMSFRRDGHYRAMKTTLRIPYHNFFLARQRMNGDFSKLSMGSGDFVPLSLVGKDDWSHCKHCNSIAPTHEFLIITPHHKPDRRDKVCDSCAEHKNEYTDEAIEDAEYKRVQRNGGQLTLNHASDKED